MGYPSTRHSRKKETDTMEIMPVVHGYPVIEGKAVNSRRHDREDEATDTASDTDTENDSDTAEDTDVPIGLPVVTEQAVVRQDHIRQFFWSILQASGVLLTMAPLMFVSVLLDGSIEREMNQMTEGLNGFFELIF